MCVLLTYIGQRPYFLSLPMLILEKIAFMLTYCL